MSTSDFVTLNGGLTVPAEPVWLALNLEAQGFLLVGLEDGTLRVRRVDGQDPATVLSGEDRAAITRWKPHLIALSDYCK